MTTFTFPTSRPNYMGGDAAVEQAAAAVSKKG